MGRVLVTGAARGLGRAIAEVLHGAGSEVWAIDVTPVPDEVPARGRRTVDVTDEAAVDRLFAELDAAGGLDGLVNNAGIFHLAHPSEEDPEQFRKVVTVNLLGTAYCGLHAIRAMLERGRGSVVNVTSGAQTGSAAMGAYGASKGAVASLTYCWAADLAGTGVRVNAVSPNAHTRMAEAYERYLGERARGQNIGKSPEVNAPAVVYLLSDASAALNGQVVRIDGDELAVMSHPAIVGEGVRHPEWTVERVAEAFAGELGARLQPIGLYRI